MNNNIFLPRITKMTGLLAAMLGSQALVAQMNPLSLGTIQAGDSVVIVYDVNINNPLPPGTLQISNQGSLSGAGFATFLTNYPGTATANDATITLLNVALPMKLISFTAQEKNNTIVLNWKATAESQLRRYEVERSVDGRNFTKIGEVAARNAAGAIAYSLVDQSPNNGSNYYRLRVEDLDGAAEYSQILRLTLHNGGQVIAIYPNPVINSSFVLQFSHVPQDDYRLEVYNSIGSRVFSQSIKHPGRSSTQTIQMGTVAPGIYHIAIRGANLSFSKTVTVQ
ncbi:T9SS C-terminal target domain-containing protein [Paraflavitalea soli]|uniref:T9SS C-terminal target domain-containing protein n=1 Tax=Paraflavitalea soli TaxID=2315862 RepID=A0A3B7MKE6_9BACT|nr:T9SS type A sorting domain-containing protein [Paraflavitalea soli]AXY73506.1 T9SS C-terminal target domain-containing protein [Paraflavitalea soli]